MYSEPNFFGANQVYPAETTAKSPTDAGDTSTTAIIPNDQTNRDNHLESTSGGCQGEPTWSNPMQPASYW